MLKGWVESWPGLEEAGASFWSSGALEVEGAVPEVASRGSSEAQEDSTLSVYDNLDKVSLCQRMLEDGKRQGKNVVGGHVRTCQEEVELEEERHTVDSSSSWSSCDIFPLDESSDAVDGVSPDLPKKIPTRLPSSQVVGVESSDTDDHDDNENANDDDDHNADEDNGNNAHHYNSPASCSVLSTSPLSTGSSEVFLPSGPSDVQEPESQSQPRDAHSLLAELRQQMDQQKAEYQARIHR